MTAPEAVPLPGKFEVGFDLDGYFVISVWRDAADYGDPAKANCIRLPFNKAVPICKMILASSGYGPDCEIFRKGADRWHKVDVEDCGTETGTELLLARMKMAHPEVDWDAHLADFHEADRRGAEQELRNQKAKAAARMQRYRERKKARALRHPDSETDAALRHHAPEPGESDVTLSLLATKEA